MPGGMRCQSCGDVYREEYAGTCKECYEEASETEEELKREIDDLKSKVAFLRLPSPDHHLFSSPSTAAAALPSDVLLLHACSSSAGDSPTAAAAYATPSVPAHRVVLISRSPVFKAMLENEMVESRSGVIKISDVSYEALRSFIHYLYTAEALLDEQMARDLLVLAEKYQVKHLKLFCEKFMTSKVNSENAIASYAFAHQHNAKQLLEAALSLVLDNMATLTEQAEYKELVEKDPRLVVEIYETYLSRQVNTAFKDMMFQI